MKWRIIINMRILGTGHERLRMRIMKRLKQCGINTVKKDSSYSCEGRSVSPAEAAEQLKAIITDLAAHHELDYVMIYIDRARE
jgi:hypothetical protein